MVVAQSFPTSTLSLIFWMLHEILLNDFLRFNQNGYGIPLSTEDGDIDELVTTRICKIKWIFSYFQYYTLLIFSLITETLQLLILFVHQDLCSLSLYSLTNTKKKTIVYIDYFFSNWYLHLILPTDCEYENNSQILHQQLGEVCACACVHACVQLVLTAAFGCYSNRPRHRVYPFLSCAFLNWTQCTSEYFSLCMQV